MDTKEILERVQEYNKTLSTVKCSPLENQYISQMNGRSYFYSFSITSGISEHKVETFLKHHHDFKNLLPQHYEKLCFYLKHIQEMTCHISLLRMSTRSPYFYDYERKIYQTIGSFYMFYGAGMNLKDLIYGKYRHTFYFGFSEIIATELLLENQEVIQYCRDVLTSENNTAVLTRDVIVAIEQSHNQELKDLLTQVFLAAKLQEGLRQSIIETVDENQIDYFISIIDVVKEHQLLRFSSIQRGILTWIGIGYDIVEPRVVESIFDCLYDYIHREDHRKEGLKHDNPLNVYLALYCLGIHDVYQAIHEAIQLLESQKRHIIASALIYLRTTKHFDIERHMDLLHQYHDDEWITALFMSEFSNYNLRRKFLSKENGEQIFEYVLQFISKMKTQQRYTSKGFEWFYLMIYRDILGRQLYEVLKRNPKQEFIIKYLPYVSSFLLREQLDEFMEKCFPKVPLEIKKPFMLKEIISHNEKLSQHIKNAYLTLQLDSHDIQQLETRLKSKKDYVRANVVEIISKQSQEMILDSYERLSRSSQKLIQQSALELQHKVPQYFDIETKTIDIKGRKDGYGLYQPYSIYPLPYKSRLIYQQKGILNKKKEIDLSFINVWDDKQILNYMKLWNQRIQEHEKDEYQVFGQYHQIGEQHMYLVNYQERSLDALPLGEVWRAYFEKDQLALNVIYQLRLIHRSLDTNVQLNQFVNAPIQFVSLDQKDIKELKYFKQYEQIFNYYFFECQQTMSFEDQAFALLEILNKETKYKVYKQKDYRNEMITYAFSNLFHQSLFADFDFHHMTDEQFQKNFPIVYESYVEFNVKLPKEIQNKLTINPLLLSRAVLLQMLPKEALIEAIMDIHKEEKQQAYSYYYGESQHLLFTAYRDAYFKGRGVYGQPSFELPQEQPEVYDYLRQTLDFIADHLLSMESQRLNEETEVTDDVTSLRVIRGARYLIMSLHVLENENIVRNTYGHDRHVVFGNIIRNCYPIETDHPDMLEKEHFPESRLVEVAMMAPQWIDFINEVLQWDGFKEACYYFIAHMKQYDYERKKAEIVKYTDIDPQDLNDGAFDMKWCQNIYQKLGEKRMNIIYKAAKFLCDNSFHVRARKYADACLSKQDKNFYLQQAKEKRNKDSLNAYCIYPIQDDQDLLERYTYVQQFLKESRQFGAQRRASEKRACEIALMNLARNSRFETETRLSWMMESEMVSQNQNYLEPQTVEDIQLWIEIDDQGKNQICVSKNNKKLKSIPAKYKKNETILKIKDVHQMWNEQYRRSRQMLEQAMEERTVFSLEEINTIAQNPIVSKMLSKLVLCSQNHFGFYDNGQLKGIRETYDFDDCIRIAHPFDLYQHQCWHDYQKYIFEIHLVQPFKQVFRELYLKLDDELEETNTKRYTGYQIQPQKAAAVLKKRQWNVSYENGLERVYHKENLIVNLFAEADWFSPSDIEAPSIDYVSFSSRNENQFVKIQDINDIVFSETMRDLDLAVSTAYVGGVDPITSFSTMELRKTIVQYTCELMKLNNVHVSDHFVNIEGQINNYSVHLGSGIVQQSGGPALHIVPVYSGKRGKVYLPFLDEDPMSAQILTKVIMLAEDTKIKDPSILQQIISK